MNNLASRIRGSKMRLLKKIVEVEKVVFCLKLGPYCFIQCNLKL